MPASIINGREIANTIREEASEQIKERISKGKKRPCLAVILVGENPASQVYVSHKEKACLAAGIESITINMRSEVTYEDVASEIMKLNNLDSTK